MEKRLENKITDEINNILYRTFTATELAEWYLTDRPSGSANASSRNEVIKALSEFDIISEKHDLIHEITEAYLHFTAYILYEDGFFANSQICDMLVSLEQVNSKMEESRNTIELINNMPVSVNPKAELMVQNQLLCNAREPVYLKSLQLTDLQMLCLRIPEALNDVIYIMGQRPFIREVNSKDKPYLQAIIKVLSTLITNSIPTTLSENGASKSKLKALIAGILNALYNEYLSFPSDDYLINLVNRSINES